jgi:CheY-like chemotaxis protein
VAFNFVAEAADDRNDIQASDRVALIVDNDIDFARFVLETAHKVGFKGITTPLGAAAIALAGEYQPQAVLLDISLPDIDGWHVLERLKNDFALQHIPVYIVSTADQLERGLKRGAQAILPKPIQTAEVLEEFLAKIHTDVERTERRIVRLEPAQQRRAQLKEMLDNSGVEIHCVDTGAALLEAIKQGPVDAVILNPEVTDMTLAALAEQIISEPAMEGRPIVLQLRPDAEADQVARWQRLAHEFNLEVSDSPARLVQQLVRWLCIPVTKLSEPCQKLLLEGNEPASVLAGKKVLIVDDDIRNIFALTSILERYDMITVSAETGRDAINLLQAAPDVDIVLMDIMMPEMDGLDTTRAIRQISKFRNLPIVAVTAKAMKGDREKCIEAGAWDYLSKPVDPEQMLSVLRAWLTVG